MENKQIWPQMLWIVRHGQSAGNVARDAAEAAKIPLIEVKWRDIDTPLSELGAEQSLALGRWFGAMPPSEQPEIILCSPYIRAHDTSRAIAAQLGNGKPALLRLDERLREREFGIFDRLTTYGIKERYPELSEQRGHVGKFYFRPPGGESWCDVILRLRSLLEMISREYAGRRVLIVAHQVTVNCMRYLLENMDEATILAIDKQGDIPNCSVTSYRFAADIEIDHAVLPELVNFLAPLEKAGTDVTKEPDVQTGSKP